MHSCTAAPLALARTITSAPVLSSVLAPANAARPSLARQKKRVSFDPQTPLNISFGTTFQEPPSTPITTSSAPQITPSRGRRGSKDLADDVDLKAVLAAGILEWKAQSAAIGLESS